MKKTTNSSPYQFEGRIPLSQAIPLGLQHVMAMFIGNLTPLIIVMGACGLTADAGFAELRTALLQNAMIIAGIVTLVQMFSIGPIGGKVPIVMGTSSGFLGVLNNTVAACGGGVIAYGAIMSAGSRAIISMSDSVERVSVASGLSPTCVIGKSTLSPVLESVTRSVPVRL